MDVKNVLPQYSQYSQQFQLPHRHAEDLNSEQDRIIGVINAVMTANERTAAGLPPLHTLLSRLDAIQGAQELNSFQSDLPPAYDVEINRGQQPDPFADGAFELDLQCALC